MSFQFKFKSNWHITIVYGMQLIFFSCPSFFLDFLLLFPCLVRISSIFKKKLFENDEESWWKIKSKGEFRDKTFSHRIALFKMIRWIYLSVCFGTTFWSVYVVILRFSSLLIFFAVIVVSFVLYLAHEIEWYTKEKCKKIVCLLM